MHVKKTEPLPLEGHRPVRICVVCGEVSYSAGGIHPQCAQEQADAPRIARIKAEQKTEKKCKAAGPIAAKPWFKACPKCGLQLHVRKRECECGYQFR